MINETYQIYEKPAATRDAPLVFTFHGTGGNEMQFSGLIGQILPEAAIVSPRGDVSEFGAARFFRRTGEGVYDMDDLNQRTEKMARFIALHRTANKGRPIYGIGYSNGANILASVLFKHPGLFDRAALLHPLIPFEPENNSGLADTQILVTAGTHDPICPLPLTERLTAFLDRQGAIVTSSIHDGGHEIRPQEITAVAEFLKA
ncbi:alpha/beta hydrolase [Martelella alba]|uniref:Alpha/beta hydrolase n=1 Tax=Martelella alba TaxID=2590451 RepID=A0A506U0S6_9HYPH|nr:alpha/beta hydrolase [Martelella alba]TPW27088.1 alpha/beta hydrolase [Martelella alba]